MVCKNIVLLLGILSIAAAETYFVEDQFGSGYLLVPLPLSRQRRQTTVDVNKNPFGTQVTLGHEGTIFENDNLSLKGKAFASKQFRPNSPTTLGGGLKFDHPSSGSELQLNTINVKGLGTDVQASGKTILWRSENENSKINARADVFKHFGGPGGNGPTKLGAGVGYEHTPSGSRVDLDVSHARDFGTNLQATANANIWKSKDGNSRFDAYASYGRHYGGIGGTSRPNYGTGFTLIHKF